MAKWPHIDKAAFPPLLVLPPPLPPFPLINQETGERKIATAMHAFIPFARAKNPEEERPADASTKDTF